jgi:hypothetical protein
MNRNPIRKAIDQVEKVITDIFENGTHDKDTGEGLYRAITLIADVRSAINQRDSVNIEVSDAISGAMLNINKIRVTASRYSDACFTDEDEDDENYIMFRLLTDFACEAHRRLKIAESELFK